MEEPQSENPKNFNLLGELGWKGGSKEGAEKPPETEEKPPVIFLDDEYESYVTKEPKSQPLQVQTSKVPKTRVQVIFDVMVTNH
jgi:hypothetical protein